ncbi:TRAP transporter small permease [Cognatishimia sp. SS12]|uniref:TRAP transporter small permease n=1 Tax=Cognatishimia sp. SS12 TaxID=2979465 RepID=UPI00233125F6|nr:TRAP transporter small permease [Cognatishimia sp. SS12]MDC0738277.1 TRAP transporter small permease [Cognatishimia sp. SS12]
MADINAKPSAMDRVEETTIAAILGTMTLLTFANVVARYGFNSNIFYALELTVFLFAWLVLLGASYAVKKTMHLGVDVIANMAPTSVQRVMALFVVVICIIYALLLLKGGWDYWAPYANLQPTSGRWFPTGFTENVRGQGWYETQDIPIPGFMRWLEGAFNDGDAYEKMPKVVPYLVMPLSALLLVIRFVQAAQRVLQGHQTLLIVSHEAEDDVAEAAAKMKD